MVPGGITGIHLNVFEKFPSREGAGEVYSLWDNEIFAECVDPSDFTFQSAVVVEILLLIEFFKLAVKNASLGDVALHWEVVMVPFCDEVFEFLQNPQFGQPVFQPKGLAFHELGQVL